MVSLPNYEIIRVIGSGSFGKKLLKINDIMKKL